MNHAQHIEVADLCLYHAAPLAEAGAAVLAAEATWGAAVHVAERTLARRGREHKKGPTAWPAPRTAAKAATTLGWALLRRLDTLCASCEVGELRHVVVGREQIPYPVRLGDDDFQAAVLRPVAFAQYFGVLGYYGG